MIVFARRPSLAVAALMLAIAARVDAQALPDAKTLIDTYAKAVGGDVFKNHKSARMKATLEVPAAGMSANIEALHWYPDRSFMMKTTIAGMGEIIAGFDGTGTYTTDGAGDTIVQLTGSEGEKDTAGDVPGDDSPACAA